MREIAQSTLFRRDIKRINKQRKDRKKLESIVAQLAADAPLASRHRDHALTGNWAGHRECHVAPDWLLIYKISDHALLLIRTGSHSELSG